MRSRTLLVIALTVAVTALAMIAATAGAGQNYASKVTIKEKEGLRGVVTSEKGRCEKSRHVNVYLKQSGPDDGYASATTNDHGHWNSGMVAIQVDKHYYAIVTAAKIAGGGTCKSDRSKTIFVH